MMEAGSAGSLMSFPLFGFCLATTSRWASSASSSRAARMNCSIPAAFAALSFSTSLLAASRSRASSPICFRAERAMPTAKSRQSTSPTTSPTVNIRPPSRGGWVSSAGGCGWSSEAVIAGDVSF